MTATHATFGLAMTALRNDGSIPSLRGGVADVAVHVCGGLKPWTAGSSSRYWIAAAFGLALTVGEGLAMTAAFRHCEEAKPTWQSMSAVA